MFAQSDPLLYNAAMAMAGESEGSDTGELVRLGERWANRYRVIWCTDAARRTGAAARVRTIWPQARWRTWDGGALPPAHASLARRAAIEKQQLALTTGGAAIRPITREGEPSETDFAVVHAWGCPCDCAYCYLQSIQSGWRPVLRADPAAVVAEVKHFCEQAPRPIRLHAGEVCDALALDPLTGIAAGLADAVRPFGDRVRLELRTKTDCVGGLLSVAPAGNAVVSFTLCPPGQAERLDFGADPPEARIAAAARCQRAGWRIGLRFDPILATHNWKAGYDALLAELAERLDPGGIGDVSLGVLRYDGELRRIMQRRRPRLSVGGGEVHRCRDGLMRPSRPVRSPVYRHLLGRLRAWLGDVPVELCMETPAVGRDCGLAAAFEARA